MATGALPDPVPKKEESEKKPDGSPENQLAAKADSTSGGEKKNGKDPVVQETTGAGTTEMKDDDDKTVEYPMPVKEKKKVKKRKRNRTGTQKPKKEKKVELPEDFTEETRKEFAEGKLKFFHLAFLGCHVDDFDKDMKRILAANMKKTIDKGKNKAVVIKVGADLLPYAMMVELFGKK
jgi:hypothetical protein